MNDEPKYAWEDKGLDEHAANELFLFIESDGDLYRQQYEPIQKNLVAKKARGTYDHALAAKLFGYLAESGAKKYDEEVNGAPRFKGRIPPEFSKKVRDAVSEELRDKFENEYDLGNYGEYIPKKYQVKPAKQAKRRASRRTDNTTTLGGMR